MPPRPALFPLAAFAWLRGLLQPGTVAPLCVGDGNWISAEDLDIAEHGCGPHLLSQGCMDLAGETPREVTGGTEPETSAQGVLAVHHLRKSYKARRVVEDVSMTVRRGEVVGLLGPNGAGKTTLFYMITGLIRPDSGLIDLDGHDVTPLPMYRRARLGIGYLPQEASIFRGLNVEDNIRAVLEIVEPDKLKRAGELEALLDEFDLEILAQDALDRALRRRAAALRNRARLGGRARPSCFSTNRSPGSIPSPWAIFSFLCGT